VLHLYKYFRTWYIEKSEVVMAFNLEMYPISYCAKYDPDTKTWNEQWIESDRIPLAELQKMSARDKAAVYEKRNQLGLPSVSYTSQYGFGCFEG
jgi:branched-chain amino acid aminotransferase